MTKTKVRVSPLLHEYWQGMAQDVNNLRAEKLRINARAEIDLQPFNHEVDASAPDVAGLLTPPWIEALLPKFYLREDGEIEGIITIVTSDLFGIASIVVSMRDEAGNIMESGDAMLDENWLGFWTYLPSIAPGVGTSLVVRAVATDGLGGLSIAEESVTLTEEYLQEASVLLESEE